MQCVKGAAFPANDLGHSSLPCCREASRRPALCMVHAMAEAMASCRRYVPLQLETWIAMCGRLLPACVSTYLAIASSY